MFFHSLENKFKKNMPTLTYLCIIHLNKRYVIKHESQNKLLYFISFKSLTCDLVRFYLFIYNPLKSIKTKKLMSSFYQQCITRGFRNVLIDAGLTSCGEIVLVNRTTIEKAGLSGGIARHSLETLKKINISELHPLG